MVSKIFLRTSIKKLKSLDLTDAEIIAKLEGIGLKESEIKEGLNESEGPETDEKKYGLEKLQFDELFSLQEETPVPIVGRQIETENIFAKPEEKSGSFTTNIQSEPKERNEFEEKIQPVEEKKSLEDKAFNEDYIEIEKIENVREQSSIEEKIENMKNDIKYWQSSSSYQLEVLQNEITELSRKSELKEQEISALDKKIDSITEQKDELNKTKEKISDEEEGYLEYEINTKIERVENKTILLGKELKKLVAIQKELLENLIQKT